MRNRDAFLALSAAVLAVSGAVAQSAPDPASVVAPTPAPPPAGDARAGHETFLRYGCYECHGTSGQGAGQFGPRIGPEPLAYRGFLHQLRAPRMLMPVYTAKVLSDQQIADIYAYLMGVPKPKPVTDLPLLR